MPERILTTVAQLINRGVDDLLSCTKLPTDALGPLAACRPMVVCLSILLIVVVMAPGCTSVSGDGWFSKRFPGDQGVASNAVVSNREKTKPDPPSDRSADQRSPIQLASWGVDIPSLWPRSNEAAKSGNPSPFAPLAKGVDTVRDGTNTLRQGVHQLQAGSVRAWDNTMSSGAQAWDRTKRLITPPLLAPSPKDDHVSFWHRLFYTDSNPPAPVTTTEFLSQERPRWGR